MSALRMGGDGVCFFLLALQPQALKEEFKHIAFLWGEPTVRDPVLPVLKEWKEDILYGSYPEHSNMQMGAGFVCSDHNMQ